MPIYWQIDSKEKLVTVTGEDEVTCAELNAYLDAVQGASAMAYRKLFDITAVHLAVTKEDMLAVGAKIRSYHSQPVGPLAIVLTHDQADLLARVLGILATADRPMRVFTRLAPAKRWIEAFGTQAGGRPQDGPPRSDPSAGSA
jgi:hypothetical protein